MVAAISVARAVLHTLVQAGLRHVVVCPGSRSAPLAYAAAELAEDGALTLHMRIDERSAAFFALGLAAAGGPPAAVVTTSGTAVANLVPAVCEADLSAVPLICLTADRPADVHGCGANQTMEQIQLMRDRTRRSWTIPAELGDAAWSALPHHVSRVWAAAVGEGCTTPGPTHLNVELREPLTPDVAAAALPPAPVVTSVPPGRSRVALAAEPRTLIVVGALAPHERAVGARVVSSAPYACLVEPTTGVADDAWGPLLVPGGSAVLDADEWLAANRPQRVIMVGRPTVNRSVAALLRHPTTQLVVAADRGQWQDPEQHASLVVPLAEVEWPDADPITHSFSAAWVRAGDRAATAVRNVTTEQWPNAWSVASAVLDVASHRRHAVVSGPSNPVRAVDVARRGASASPLYALRGVAGIDGVLSAAAGIAQHLGGATAIVGDLTFLHDSNALWQVSGQQRPPLTIVVVNDDGGGIFEHLEHAQAVPRECFDLLFGTPTGADLEALCRAAGVPHHRVHTAAELIALLSAETTDLRVLEIHIHRGDAPALRAQIRDAVAKAVPGP